MKIHTRIARFVTIGAIAAGGLTLTTGTAHAAVNCSYLANQISVYQNYVRQDWGLQLAYTIVGNYDQASYWANELVNDESVVDSYRSRFITAHCA